MRLGRFLWLPALILLISSAALGQWQWGFEGRGEGTGGDDWVRLKGKIAHVKGLRAAGLELHFRARASGPAPEIWARLAYRDRHDNLAVALRGHVCQDVLVFRFKPAGDRLVAIEPLPFELRAGRWYDVNVECDAGVLTVYVDGAKVLRRHLPSRLEEGSVGFGGGTCQLEVREVGVKPLEQKPPERARFAPSAIKINFGPAGTKLPAGWKNADDSAYDRRRGYGWIKPPAGTRRRGVEKDPLLDTLVPVAHGVGEAVFRVDLPDGEYLLTVCGGDPSFPARLEWWVDEEDVPWVAEDLPRRVYKTYARPVNVRGGRLVLRVVSAHPDGQPGGVINWMVVERRADVEPARWQAAARQWEVMCEEMKQRAADERWGREFRESLRQTQRRAWKPLTLPDARGPRGEVELGRRWLFLPEHERRLGEEPWTCTSRDRHWHVMDVPAFWQPTKWWIFGSGSGVSDNWRQIELERCNGYTFQWRKTRAAWYRQRFFLPASYRGRRLVLRFEAVARACQVWLNGRDLGAHFGMFGPWQVDITDAARPGAMNVLTMLVARRSVRPAHDDLRDTIDERLFTSLVDRVPHGMYGEQGGIWGPVKLIATRRPYIADVFFQSRMDGARVDVEVGGLAAGATGGRSAPARTTAPPPPRAKARDYIKPAAGATRNVRAPVLRWRLQKMDGKKIAEGQVQVGGPKVSFEIADARVEPWWPERPRLYTLALALTDAAGRATDERSLTVGFRTIEVRGNRIYLNGRPYWLRGANHAPSGLRPWSRELAGRFMRLMHDGHQMVTRTHGAPYTECWLDAADRKGVAVSVEGIWPWALHISGGIPSREVLKVWHDDWLAVMRASRNHPSVVMWTVNNEMFFYLDRDLKRRMAKWKIVSDLIRDMRKLDPTRPVVMDSAYVRRQSDVDTALKQGFDDGDIDDMHRYYGWYSVGPLWLFGRKMEQAFRGDRPGVSQEFSTGYPNVDTGHPTRMYIDRNQVAQAWVGDWAYEDRDPAVFLQRQAWLTKELAELGRREAQKLCGLLHFATCTWVRHCYDPKRMKPFPTYYALKTALQPVLVSWESKQRHFYEGARIGGRVWVVNDDVLGGDLADVKVAARVLWRGRTLARAQVDVGDVRYYERRSAPLTIKLPESLPAERCDATLELEARAGGRVVSRNSYPLLLARRSWVAVERAPAGADAALKRPASANGAVALVDGEQAAAKLSAHRDDLMSWLRAGGRLVMLAPGKAAAELFPEVVAAYISKRTETANLWREESAVFNGLGPLDIAWLAAPDGDVCAAEGFFRLRRDLGQDEGLPAEVIATTMRAHSYIGGPGDIVRRKLWGACVVRIRVGRGQVILSSLNLAGRDVDPVAGRLYRNIIAAAQSAAGRER